MIPAVQEVLQANRRVAIADLADQFEFEYGTMHDLLHDDLNLVKKSARWVPKLLTVDQMETRVECAKEFLNLVGKGSSRSKLHRIITMDETMVSLHTPETKNQGCQWLPKGSPAPTKANIQASSDNRMILAFFRQ